MEHEFWHRRWANKEIGFHQGSVNEYLYEHWPELAANNTGTVLVPLCGKAHDLWWLHDRGHPIIGVELNDIACKDFFEEGNEKAMVHPGEPFNIFRHDNLEIWNGDFFQLAPPDLSHVRLVYDRAALIALPPTMRRDYVDHLTAVTPEDIQILLITLDYEGAATAPPFNVGNDEIQSLYEADYRIELIHTQTLANDHPFAKRKGLSGATENVFRLEKR